ncbi:class I SAM-dependent methyltransferase [Pseudomonadota bacterium]
MRIIDHLMGFPCLYAAVQNTIAAGLHRDVKTRLCNVIPDQKGVKILDIGCGLGDYSILFRQSVYTGLDWDERYIKRASAHYGRKGITFVVGDAAQISFPAGHFAYCFSVGLYHHMSDEAVVASLSEALRVAGPGKVTILDAIYPLRGNWPGYLLRKLDRGKFVRAFEAYSKLLNDHFSMQEISAHRAGVFDYIYYRL